MARCSHQRPIRLPFRSDLHGYYHHAAANAHRQRDPGAQSTHPNRFRQIAKILARNGFGFIIGRVGHEGRIPWPKAADGSARKEAMGLSGPERVRLTIEELGPTFVKLGQILSTRGSRASQLSH